MNKLAYAALLALLAAAPAQADQFCTTLKKVIADANGFAHIRGKTCCGEDNTYAQPIVRLNASCAIDMKGDAGIYRCDMPHGGDGKADATALSSKVQACLAIAPNIPGDISSDQSTYVFPSGGTWIVVDFELGDLTLWVGPPIESN